MNNNNYPFWIKKHLERLNYLEITFHSHFFKRKYRNISDELCKEAIKDGKIVLIKSLWPGKIVFKKYFGKENETYVVVVLFKLDRIEVRTAWKKEGR